MRLTKGFREYLSRMLEQFLAGKLAPQETYQFIMDCHHSGYLYQLPPMVQKKLIERYKQLQELH